MTKREAARIASRIVASDLSSWCELDDRVDNLGDDSDNRAYSEPELEKIWLAITTIQRRLAQKGGRK